MKMNAENERKLWRNWLFLKQELPVLEVTDKMIAAGILSETHKHEIQNVKPNSKLMRAEKFLNLLIETGDKGYETFCNIIKKDGKGKFEEISEKLEILPKTEEDAENENDNLQEESNEKKQSIQFRSDSSRMLSSLSRTGTEVVGELPSDPDPVQAVQSVHAAAAAMANVVIENKSVDMKTLEKELVKIAPTIAELFQRISQTTQQPNPSHDELQRLKADNERLRRTNKALIEKLNTFQKQIIQLQIENKKLRESGVCENNSKAELEAKALELEELRQKLEEQKEQLINKDAELNEQLEKIRAIEEENERQKIQILKLEVLHDEGVSERSRQQQQITELRAERDKQKYKIDMLEDMQKADEERLERLEVRLRLLEQCTPSPNWGSSYGTTHARRKNARVVSPPRSMPWMSGVVNRSHHANVKFTPPPPRGGRNNDKGWSF